MNQLWVGVTEIGLGLIFCFLGHSAARVVLGLWGAVVGFVAGSVLYVAVYQYIGGGPLGWVPSWVFAIALALLLAWLSFAFYVVGVLLSMGSVGFGLGQLLSSALHFPPWLSFAMALVTAAGLVMIGWTLNLPKLLLVVLTAVVGAGAVVDGAQLLTGSRLDWFDQSLWQVNTVPHVAWTGAFVALALTGILVQLRQNSEDTLRDAYRSK